MGEKWRYGIRIIYYIVVIPMAIFPGAGWQGGGGGGEILSDRSNYPFVVQEVSKAVCL